MSISSKMSGGAITATNMAECWRCTQNSITRRPLTLIGKLQKLCVTIPTRNTHAPGMKPHSSRPAPGPHLWGPGRPLQVILLPSEKLCRSRIKPARPRSIRHYPCFWPSLRCGRHIGNTCAHQSAGCLMNKSSRWALRVLRRPSYAALSRTGSPGRDAGCTASPDFNGTPAATGPWHFIRTPTAPCPPP